MIGITGSDEKCKWLIDELGFDSAVNYKLESFKTKLREATPNGVNCYFDNVGATLPVTNWRTFKTCFYQQVGGELSNAVIMRMKDSGRIAVCGSLSVSNIKVGDEIPQSKKTFDG